MHLRASLSVLRRHWFLCGHKQTTVRHFSRAVELWNNLDGSLRLLFKDPFLRQLHNDPFVISEEVSAALSDGRPIVALETSLLTHGMQYPENVSTQTELEDVLRARGVVPATVGVHEGRLHVGLSRDALESLAKMGSGAAKISRRDLPAALSKGLSGGTTVSATMLACNRAGVQVFATGGIGGVHRGGESSLDISADLKELGRTPVTVVCAGAKSILDIGRTLEILETEGVCVAAFGESQEFPAFFTARSGHRAPWRVSDATEAAAMIASRNALHLDGAVLLAVPIPAEFEADGQAIEDATQLALKEAQEAGLTGNAVTPFILQRVVDRTGGASLRANIALIKNNTTVAADIAIALAKLEGGLKRRSLFQPPIPRQPATPVVIGGAVVDIVVNCTEDRIQLTGATHSGRIRTSWGGVGRNVADCLARLLQDEVRLVSAVGCDRHGQSLLEHNLLLDTGGVWCVEGARTASYCTLLDRRGDCLFGVGDMDVHRNISPQLVQRNQEHISRAPIVVLDGNVPDETVSYVLRLCGESQVPVWFEPTDVRKAVKPFLSDAWRHLFAVSPNLAELRAMHAALATALGTANSTGGPRATRLDVVEEGAHLGSQIAQHIPLVLVTLGSQGALLIEKAERTDTASVKVLHYPATKLEFVQSVSGAGDCLAGGFLSGLLRRLPRDRCMGAGMMAAQRSLLSSDTVPDTVRPDCLDAICTPREVHFNRTGTKQ